MSYQEAVDATDIQLNLFWQAKDEYLETYYPSEHRRNGKLPTMIFSIYNGIERTTNIFHINFNKWEVTNADRQEFEHYLRQAFYDVMDYEYGGEIDD